MAGPTKKAIAHAFLKKYGKTFAEQLKIRIQHNNPSSVIQLLCVQFQKDVKEVVGRRVRRNKNEFELKEGA
ncbi:MAG: hypothetical protein ACOCW2_00075 [Chitinivibrionales bacterium]